MRSKPGMRTIYMARFIGRCIILALCLWAYFFRRDAFAILHGWNFFRAFSPFHLLWGIWMIDMLLQLIPTRGFFSLGSQKVFRMHFRPMLKKFSRSALRKYICETTASAYRVMVLWIALTAILGGLYHAGIIDAAAMLLISAVFYVCDLICVLFWCPFRHWIMKNRCCTTCRIFNWDYIMICTPLMVLKGPLVLSACILSVVLLIRWEITHLRHPHRFYESSNRSMRCNECQEHLCKYKRSLRKSK
jgi:hypothetical protein